MGNKVKYVPFTKLIPNISTLTSLCFGILAVYHSNMMHWEKACFFIITATIFDLLDGRFATILNARSDFGANLDSLCDFANYTIFPSMIMYNWSLWNHGIFGWYAVMVTSICGVIRLARFNTQDQHIQHPIRKKFFYGIPSPAAGILIILPLIIQFSFSDFLNHSIQYPPLYLYEVYISVISITMVGTFPTLSLKYLRIQKKYMVLAVVGVSMAVISFFVFKWQAVVFFSLLYVLSIPLASLKYISEMKQFCKSSKHKVTTHE